MLIGWHINQSHGAVSWCTCPSSSTNFEPYRVARFNVYVSHVKILDSYSNRYGSMWISSETCNNCRTVYKLCKLCHESHFFNPEQWKNVLQNLFIQTLMWCPQFLQVFTLKCILFYDVSAKLMCIYTNLCHNYQMQVTNNSWTKYATNICLHEKCKQFLINHAWKHTTHYILVLDKSNGENNSNFSELFLSGKSSWKCYWVIRSRVIVDPSFI